MFRKILFAKRLQTSISFPVQRGQEQELQRLSDLSVALGFLCEHFISSVCHLTYPGFAYDLMVFHQISVFLQRTSPVLQTSLKEEASSAKAYVDVLRYLITSSLGRNLDKKLFTQAVLDICKIGSGVRVCLVIYWLSILLTQCNPDT